MNAARSVLADLVARRLWPVAVILVAALVAVPLLLRGSEENAPTVPATSGAAGVDQPLVALANDQPEGGRTPIGRNPFAQRRVAPEGSSSAAGATVLGAGDAPGATLGTGDSDTGAGGGGGGVGSGLDVGGDIPGLDDIDVIPVGGGGSGGSGGTGSGSGTESTDKRDSYRVDLRFGTAGSLSARRDVPRLSPLPSSDEPFFVFLGVLADGKTALFLVSSDATATGDGTCRPDPRTCERVELQAGETEFFDVTRPNGEVKQYQLDVVNVSRQRSASAAVASSARSREDSAGRKVLDHAIDTKQVDVSGLAYSRELGLVVPTGQTPRDRSLFGGFRTDLRFGTPDAMIKRYNLARLTPLPSIKEPSLIYMGVIGDENEAFFLNPTEAPTSGDAVCDPSPDECSRVRLKAGESGVFDVPRIDGGTTEYRLDVDAISRVEADSPAKAVALRNRESKAGRVVLRRLINEVGGLVSDVNYSATKGKLVKVDGSGS